MPQSFTRDRFTWLAYCLLAFFGCLVNVLGPVMPFLKDDLGLSYTVSSLHFSALAAGILVVGFTGHWLIQRAGRLFILWNGAVGMSLGALLLIVGKTPALTIGAAFVMGVEGALILAVGPAALSDHHGAQGAAAISEANVIAASVGAAAPLLVGWSARALGDWRLALAAIALLPLAVRLGLGKVSLKEDRQAQTAAQDARPLPPLYWLYWCAIVLSEAVEYCMIFWSPDYLERELGLLKADAALAASLFLVAMIVGRMAGSWLVRRFTPRILVTGSLVLALGGFLIFWTASSPVAGMAGLFITGLGVACLYPLTLSLAIDAADGSTIQAGARATLSTGTSILVLPLVLGRLADGAGIRLAFGMVAILLVCTLVLIQAPGRLAPARPRLVD
jgi:fucose permease